MDDYEASQLRMVSYRDSLGELRTSVGSSVYSVTDKGVVISVMSTRKLIPWHNVTEFTYHAQDTNARKVIQGY